MEPLFDGGQGRTGEQVYNDGVNVCWAILLGIVLIASCIGCARSGRTLTEPRKPYAGESVPIDEADEIERGRTEREELRRSGKSLERLTGN